MVGRQGHGEMASMSHVHPLSPVSGRWTRLPRSGCCFGPILQIISGSSSASLDLRYFFQKDARLLCIGDKLEALIGHTLHVISGSSTFLFRHPLASDGRPVGHGDAQLCFEKNMCCSHAAIQDGGCGELLEASSGLTLHVDVGSENGAGMEISRPLRQDI